jgi:hypothetical protein
VLLAPVDEMGVGRDVVERGDELLVGERLPVDRDALGHPLDVRAGEAPGAQVQGAQQGVDHPGRRGLAVGPGELDDRVAGLRVAEQLGERADPVQGRIELGLGPARQERVLRLREGLGGTGLGGRCWLVGHLATSLGSHLLEHVLGLWLG